MTAKGWRKRQIMQWVPSKKKEQTDQEPDDLTNVRYKANYRYETKWQSLTDDEIKEIIGSYAGPIKGYTRELFDKIEAKLREKNT